MYLELLPVADPQRVLYDSEGVLSMQILHKQDPENLIFFLICFTRHDSFMTGSPTQPLPVPEASFMINMC